MGVFFQSFWVFSAAAVAISAVSFIPAVPAAFATDLTYLAVSSATLAVGASIHYAGNRHGQYIERQRRNARRIEERQQENAALVRENNDLRVQVAERAAVANERQNILLVERQRVDAAIERGANMNVPLGVHGMFGNGNHPVGPNNPNQNRP